MCLISSFFGTGRSTKETTTAIAYSDKDWKETPEEHVIKVDLLGLKKVVVMVGNETMQIEISVAEQEKKKNHSKHHRVEHSSSGRGFHRRYRVPENAILDEYKLLLENGVLTVTFPKKDIKKPVLITGLDN